MRNPVVTRRLIIKNETIKRDHETKFLGVIPDEKFTWADRILYIKVKIAKRLGIICKVRRLHKLSLHYKNALYILIWTAVLMSGVIRA